MVIDQDAKSRPQAFSFDTFRLFPGRRILLKGDTPVTVGARALDLLIVLVHRAGVLLSNDELLAQAWPQAFVEGNTLRVQLSALRRALGERQDDQAYIVNIPGRGYLFTAPVSTIEVGDPPPAQASGAGAAHNLPQLLTEVFGRDSVIATVLEKVTRSRFCSIIGPGGIGKTTVALGVAQKLLPNYRDGAWFLDLAPLADGRLVASAIIAALGNLVTSDPSIAGLVASLARKEMLLVFDNCEHVIEAACQIVEAILDGAPHVRVLATSREPLRASGENLHHLAPLDVPSHPATRADEALSYSAVQLFVARASALSSSFSVSDQNAALIGDVCRRLDGIALGIELAASHVSTYGLQDLSSRLDDRFRLLTRGRRTALPRHQTLIAAVDWSYDLLAPAEQVVWRRLAIFAGSFTVEAASAVAAGTEFSAWEILDYIGRLVSKSLVVADLRGASACYRLLETMRAYAGVKLAESGEHAAVARQHALYFRDLFGGSAVDARHQDAKLEPTIDRIDFFRSELNNVRVALDWAFSADGDSTIGIGLTAAYAPVWLYLSLITECRERVERALDRLRPELELGTRFELQLTVTLGQVLNVDRQAYSAWKVEAVLAQALTLARNLNDLEAELRVLWVSQVHYFYKGDFAQSQKYAERFLAIGSQIGVSFHIGDGHRMIGNVALYAGDQSRACQELRQAVGFNIRPSANSHIMWGHYDQDVFAQTRLARALWIHGDLAEAEEVAERAAAAAWRSNHQLSIGMALAEAACFVATMKGDLAAAAAAHNALTDLASQNGFVWWKRVGDCLEGRLLIRRGAMAAGTARLTSALDALTDTGLWLYYPEFIADLAEGLAATAGPDKGLALLDAALFRTKTTAGAGWYAAEFLRLKGELLLAQSPTGPSLLMAETCFQDAMDLAASQGAGYWTLRIGLSTARLRILQNRRDDAVGILRPIASAFTDGCMPVDLRDAHGIIASVA